MTLLVQETFINKTEGYLMGEEDPYVPFTDNVAKLFRSMQKEYGKSVSKSFVDIAGKSRPIGWVFQKRMKYEDARTNTPKDYYVREVWVTLLDKEDTVVRTQHYAFLDNR